MKMMEEVENSAQHTLFVYIYALQSFHINSNNEHHGNCRLWFADG